MLAVTMAVTAKARILQPLALQWVASIISETLAHQISVLDVISQ